MRLTDVFARASFCPISRELQVSLEDRRSHLMFQDAGHLLTAHIGADRVLTLDVAIPTFDEVSDEPVNFSWEKTLTLAGDRLTMDIELPMFDNLEMRMQVEEGRAQGTLLPDHKIPWFEKRKLKTKIFRGMLDLAAFCEREVQIRTDSAVAWGSRIIPVPEHIRVNAEPGVYLRCLQASKAISGAAE
jgi:hypothetical protein